ncbi:MAG: thioredoxin domain-containing protein, partial [Promethearchaeota archaeon]
MTKRKMKHVNQLIHEKSPYLLQHAHNPVNWFPWGDKAFAKAKKEDKPIFLSIGYSTCHWCHVMERESFENSRIAKLMNDAFVNIKVDREERPDIDSLYMSVAQMMTGGGGWPLTIIMTPDKRPFFAATYIPPESRFGRIGMDELIPEIQRLWKQDRKRLDTITKNIQESL